MDCLIICHACNDVPLSLILEITACLLNQSSKVKSLCQFCLTLPLLVTFKTHFLIPLLSCWLIRAVVESVHKLDVIIGSKSSYREVFKPENISLRNKWVQFRPSRIINKALWCLPGDLGWDAWSSFSHTKFAKECTCPCWLCVLLVCLFSSHYVSGDGSDENASCPKDVPHACWILITHHMDTRIEVWCWSMYVDWGCFSCPMILSCLLFAWTGWGSCVWSWCSSIQLTMDAKLKSSSGGKFTMRSFRSSRPTRRFVSFI